jgi:hypothetical protein
LLNVSWRASDGRRCGGQSNWQQQQEQCNLLLIHVSVCLPTPILRYYDKQQRRCWRELSGGLAGFELLRVPITAFLTRLLTETTAGRPTTEPLEECSHGRPNRHKTYRPRSTLHAALPRNIGSCSVTAWAPCTDDPHNPKAGITWQCGTRDVVSCSSGCRLVISCL